MCFHYSKEKREILKIINSDINSKRRYVDKGYVVDGEINSDKIILQLCDNYGKSSSFTTPLFYGTIEETTDGSTITGKCRMKTSSLILLAILFVISIESIITSFFFTKSLTDIVIPWLVFVGVIVYFLAFCLGNRSKEFKSMFSKYLNSLNQQ